MCARTGPTTGFQPFSVRCQASIIAVVVVAVGALTSTTCEVVAGMPCRVVGEVAQAEARPASSRTQAAAHELNPDISMRRLLQRVYSRTHRYGYTRLISPRQRI